MKKNLYGIVDSLGSVLIGVDLNSLDPEQYLAEQNRANLRNPSPLGEHAHFVLLGNVDDQSLVTEMLPVPRPIGDLSWSVNILKAEYAKRKEEGTLNA